MEAVFPVSRHPLVWEQPEIGDQLSFLPGLDLDLCAPYLDSQAKLGSVELNFLRSTPSPNGIIEGDRQRLATPSLEESGIAHVHHHIHEGRDTACPVATAEATTLHDPATRLGQDEKDDSWCRPRDGQTGLHKFFKDSFDFINKSLLVEMRNLLICEPRELNLMPEENIQGAFRQLDLDIVLNFTLKPWIRNLTPRDAMNDHIEALLCDMEQYQVRYAQRSELLCKLAVSVAAWKRSWSALRTGYILDWRRDPIQLLNGSSTSLLWDQESSDSCDTDDEEDESYRVLRRTLDGFRHDASKASMIISPITDARKRKDIRAWARLANYGCTTLFDQSILLHKDKAQIPKRPRKSMHSRMRSSSQAAAVNGRNIWEARDPDQYMGYSSGGSMSEAGSVYSWKSGQTRPRHRSKANGYPCTFQGCQKVYSRACDLSHHERSHRAKEEQPCECTQCGKRFPYPKDLRRHSKVHSRAPSLGEPLGTVFQSLETHEEAPT